MNENSRNPSNNNNEQAAAEGGNADDEVEFGDFEGFEGAAGLLEGVQAQAAPSPWATFPDLLPVQTSPATPAEEGEAASGDNWTHRAHSEPPVVPRVSNPPDVSLGARPPPSEALLHASGGEIPSASLGVDGLAGPSSRHHGQHQSSSGSIADYQRQFQILTSRITELERQLAQSHRECAQLTLQVQHLRDENERSRIEGNTALLQKVANDVQASSLQCLELRNNFQHLSARLDSLFQNPHFEQRLTSTIQQAVESALQQHINSPESLLSHATVPFPTGGSGEMMPDFTQILRQELQRHSSQERRVLAREHREVVMRFCQALLKECQKLSEEDPPNNQKS